MMKRIFLPLMLVVLLGVIAGCGGGGGSAFTAAVPQGGSSVGDAPAKPMEITATYRVDADVQKQTLTFTPLGADGRSADYDSSVTYSSNSVTWDAGAKQLSGNVVIHNNLGGQLVSTYTEMTAITDGVTANNPDGNISGHPYWNFATISGNSDSASKTFIFSDPGSINFSFTVVFKGQLEASAAGSGVTTMYFDATSTQGSVIASAFGAAETLVFIPTAETNDTFSPSYSLAAKLTGSIPSASAGGGSIVPGSSPNPAEMIHTNDPEVPNNALPLKAGSPWMQPKAPGRTIVGDTYSFYEYYNSPTAGRIAATCRGVGTHCYVWVDDTKWADGTVTQAIVDDVIDVFDNHAYDTVRAVFGHEWCTNDNPYGATDIDNDAHVSIFLVSNAHGANSFAGYYWSTNEFPRVSTAPYPSWSDNSNERQMFYFATEYIANTTFLHATLPHEFQHMCHFYQKTLRKSYAYGYQETWVNEGCSEFASEVAGYPYNRNASFCTRPYTSLTKFDDGNYSYATVSVFFRYLGRQFTNNLFYQITQSNSVGLTCVNDALVASGYTDQMADAVAGGTISQGAFSKWAVANYVNDQTGGTIYGYSAQTYSYTGGTAALAAFDIGTVTKATYGAYPASRNDTDEATYKLKPWGTGYIEFTTGDNTILELTVTAGATLGGSLHGTVVR